MPRLVKEHTFEPPVSRAELPPEWFDGQIRAFTAEDFEQLKGVTDAKAIHTFLVQRKGSLKSAASKRGLVASADVKNGVLYFQAEQPEPTAEQPEPVEPPKARSTSKRK